MLVEWRSSQRTASVLDHEVLNDKGEDGDAKEPSVVADVGEDVELPLSKLTSVELVEELHEHEGLEDDGVELALLSSQAKLGIPFIALCRGD